MFKWTRSLSNAYSEVCITEISEQLSKMGIYYFQLNCTQKTLLKWGMGKLCSKFGKDRSINYVTFLSTDAGRLHDFIFCPMHMHSTGQTTKQSRNSWLHGWLTMLTPTVLLNPTRGYARIAETRPGHKRRGKLQQISVDPAPERTVEILQRTSTHTHTLQDRYSIFASHLLRNEELRKVQPISLIRFARTTKRLMWPAVTSGLRIGLSQYGLIAGQD